MNWRVEIRPEVESDVAEAARDGKHWRRRIEN
jgi:hypothetical protein